MAAVRLNCTSSAAFKSCSSASCRSRRERTGLTTGPSRGRMSGASFSARGTERLGRLGGTLRSLAYRTSRVPWPRQARSQRRRVTAPESARELHCRPIPAAIRVQHWTAGVQQPHPVPVGVRTALFPCTPAQCMVSCPHGPRPSSLSFLLLKCVAGAPARGHPRFIECT